MANKQSYLWSELTREGVASWVDKGAVVIVPIGSTEQHGRHLPVSTDCRTVDAVSRRLAESLTDVPILVAPLLPIGVSPHHMMYGPGTISLGVNTVVRMVGDICESLIAQGFERILFLSGHGGNRNTLQAAANEIKHRRRRQIEALCWWDLCPEIWDQVREGPDVTISHSGEIETSAMMAVAPETVRTDRLELVPGMTDDPSLATLDKGEAVIEAALVSLAVYVRVLAARPGREVVGIERAPIE